MSITPECEMERLIVQSQQEMVNWYILVSSLYVVILDAAHSQVTPKLDIYVLYIPVNMLPKFEACTCSQSFTVSRRSRRGIRQLLFPRVAHIIDLPDLGHFVRKYSLLINDGSEKSKCYLPPSAYPRASFTAVISTQMSSHVICQLIHP